MSMEQNPNVVWNMNMEYDEFVDAVSKIDVKEMKQKYAKFARQSKPIEQHQIEYFIEAHPEYDSSAAEYLLIQWMENPETYRR